MALNPNEIILDLSEWQYDVDFAKLKTQCAAVILRVQAGSSHPDTRYQQYVQGCKDNGIPFSTYAYVKAISVADAIKESNDAFDRSDKASLNFLVDVEENDYYNKFDIVAGSQAFVDNLRTRGFNGKVLLYSYDSFYSNWGLSAVKADGHWIAAYGANDGNPHTSPTNAADLWQFTSVGHVDGINTNVDESELTGTVPMSWFTGVPATPAKPIMTVKVLQASDVRSQPDHNSTYIGNVYPDQMYNVWARSGDWHYIILHSESNVCGWVDGNNGKNLYWLDNPALVQHQYYVVQSGDYVSKIAAKFGTTIQEIKRLNNLDANYTIYPNQNLQVK